MNLEDHVGDVIRKARTMRAVNIADAAKAAGLSAEEFAVLEHSGSGPRPLDFPALAALLKLDGPKLTALAAGWQPAPLDPGTWREFRQITTTQNGNTVHCYLVWDEVTREAALFDTGFEAEPIFTVLEENGAALKHLFITHSHHDHVEALGPLRERFPTLRIHTDMQGAPPQSRNRRNDCVHVGSLRVTNRETPGHAIDGVTYLIGNWPEDAPHVAMVGDAIFAGSMGGAKEHGEIAKARVREQILTLPPDTLICAGHGPLTTVAEEKAHNPFF
ncbi:MAG: MBL fold metallo-hydrolase [Verrucomicrobia bacterium]|nr:MBL fold metallo-hydrolase [Verrucomicrobiota bacterium]